MIRPQVKTVREKSSRYLKWVKTQGCLAYMKAVILNGQTVVNTCSGPIDPHHTVPRSLRGSDLLAVPLCRKHHDEVGTNTFQSAMFQHKYRVYFSDEILRLNDWFRREHPKPKKERKKQTRATKTIHHCASCRRPKHELAWDKVQETEDGRILYRCPTTNAQLEARK